MTGTARRVKGNFRQVVRIWLGVEIVIANTFAPSGTARAAAGLARVEAYYGTAPRLTTDPTGQPFEVHLDDGWVRSNRPVAALLFAGLTAKASTRGWDFAAACGAFLAGTTPYDGVRAITHSTQIVAPGHQPSGLIERAKLWHRCAEGLAPADSLLGTPVAELKPSYPSDLDYLEKLPTAKKQEAFSNYLRHRLTPAAGPSATARKQLAQRIDEVLQEAVAKGHEDVTMLDYFYEVEPVHHRSTQVPAFRLADAPDRDEIEQLLTDVEGFDSQALSTLWAASALGVSSAAAEAVLRQALWRATFDSHLDEVNQ